METQRQRFKNPSEQGFPRTVLLLLLLLLAGCSSTTSSGPSKSEDLLMPPEELQPAGNPPSHEEVKQTIDRGVQFLLKHQNEDGSWGTPEKTKGLNIFAPVPGGHHAFHSASTALSLAGLVEANPKSPEAKKAIRRGMIWLIEFLPKLRRATPTAIYNVWAHSYSIQALVRLLDHPYVTPGEHEQIRYTIKRQIEKLANYEFVRGGWGYYDFRIGSDKPAGMPNSFTTATVLVAFKEAQKAGFHIPDHLVKRGKRVIHRQQKPNFSYLYSAGHRYYPMYSINRPGGSLGRSQTCNAALRMWGDKEVSDRVLRAWLDRLFLRNGWLDMGRKRPVPHESWFAVAGYFYYYGHFYSSYCMQMLPRKDQTLYAKHAAEMYIDKQEPDGSWWDYPLYNYHKYYGTGFALMSLSRIREMYSSSP